MVENRLREFTTDQPVLQRTLEGMVYTKGKNKHSKEAAEKTESGGRLAVMQRRAKKVNTTKSTK